MALEVFDAKIDVRNLFITPEIRSRIMRFEAGEVSQGHTHDIGHEMFLVVDGQAEFTIAGQSAVLGPGMICVARAGEWHEIRTLPDQPMTLYLSVTPHIEPTHTLWDHEGGTQLPHRFGGSTRAERLARTTPEPAPETLVSDHLRASHGLAESARENAAAQESAAANLRRAIEQNDSAGAHAALEEMWRGFSAMYASLQASERAWNELAPSISSRLDGT